MAESAVTGDKPVSQQQMTPVEESGRRYRRQLQGYYKWASRLLGCTVTIFTFYTAFTGSRTFLEQCAIHLSLVLPLVFLYYPARRGRKRREQPTLVDVAMAVIALASYGWVVVEFERISQRLVYVDPIQPVDFWLGVCAVLLVLEATRRSLGWTLVVIAIAFILYAFAGPYMPGEFTHNGVSSERLIEHLYLQPEGLFGTVMFVVATFIFTFLAFGAFLTASGGDRHFLDFASALTGSRVGGPAKVSIAGSAALGTLSGSTVANVGISGPITIPLMRRVGYRRVDAAAIEAAASTGGSITPPVMGAGIFLISAFTGVAVIDLIGYSVAPAIIYFISLYAFVHFRARKEGFQGIPKTDLPSARAAAKNGWHLVVPIVGLVYFLLIGFTPFYASAVATVLLVVLIMARRVTRLSLRRFIDALEGAGTTVLMLSSMSATAGMIVGVVTVTGLVNKVTGIILGFAGGSLLLGVLLVAVIGYIIGGPLPVTASYIIVAAVAAPALSEMGLPIVAAHLVIFWLVQNATLTPPICTTAFVAAELAQAPPMRVGWQSVRAAKALYVIPLLIAFSPLITGSVLEIIFTAICAGVALLLAESIFHGYFVMPLRHRDRAALVISAALLLVASLGSFSTAWPLAAVGGALALAVYLSQVRLRRGAGVGAG